MDANQLQGLDPKLREAYERVMGTNAAPRPGQPAPIQPVQADQPAVPAQPQAPQPPMQPPPPAMPAPQPVAPPPPAQMPPQSAPAYTAPQPMQQQPAAQQPQYAPAPADAQHPLNQPYQSTLAAIDSTDATQMHAYVSDEVAGVKQSLKLIQMVYIIGGIIFFAVYALFWVNFFSVALPF